MLRRCPGQALIRIGESSLPQRVSRIVPVERNPVRELRVIDHERSLSDPSHAPKGFSTENIQYNTIQYNTIQYNTIQYNTIQYNAMQCNTIQHNTIQHNTMQYKYNTLHTCTIQYSLNSKTPDDTGATRLGLH